MRIIHSIVGHLWILLCALWNLYIRRVYYILLQLHNSWGFWHAFDKT